MLSLRSTLSPPTLTRTLSALFALALAVVPAAAQDSGLTIPAGDVRARIGEAEGTIQLKEAECEALLERYLSVQSDIFEMNTALEFAVQFDLVQRSIDEAKEALKTTGADAEATAQKISDAYEKLRLNNEQLGETVRTLSGGLERAGKSFADTAAVLGDMSEVLTVLEIAVRSRDASPSDTLRAFAEYFNTISNKLEPLLESLPVVGVFISLYADAILAIAEDVEDIEREVAERNKKMRDLFGPERAKLYLSPPTERELKERRIAEKEAELGTISTALLEGCGGRVERTADGLAPVSVDPLAVEMRRARERIRTDYADKAAEVEEAFAAVGEPLAELNKAQEVYDALFRTRTTLEDMAKLQAELLRLAPRFRDDVRRQIRAAEIHAEEMARALAELNEKQETYHRLRRASLRLEREYTSEQRQAMLKLAEQIGWDEWWVRFNNPDLFDQGRPPQ